LVEGFEDGVVAGGDEGGHVERGADLGAAAADAALTPELTAVVVEGGDAGEGGGLGVGEGSEFGHEGDEREGGDEADASDFLEASDPGCQCRGEFDFCGDEGLDFGFLFFQGNDGARKNLEKGFVGEGFFEIIVLGDLDEDVTADLRETGELLLERVGKGKRAGMEDLGELCDGFRVQGVGLGKTAFGFGEVADLSGIDASDGKTCAVGLGDEEGFVAATGFADEHGVGGKGFEEGANGFFGVRDLRGLAVVVDVEEEFRNVDTEVGCHEVVFQGGWFFSGMFFLRLAIRTQRFRQLFKIETCVEGGSS